MCIYCTLVYKDAGLVLVGMYKYTGWFMCNQHT